MGRKSRGVPYARLAAFYLLYFASLGAFMPYWGPYLRSLGFGPVAIGELTAVIMVTKVIAPNIWGWVADHFGRRLYIVRLASLAATAVFAVLLSVRGYWGIFWVLAGFSFFWNAALPQFEAITLNHLGPHTHRYSRVRLWGSVGFILTVVFLGRLFDGEGIQWLPLSVLLLLSGIWLSTLFVPDDQVERLQHGELHLWGVLRDGSVVGLFLAFFLAQASHGAYYAFFSVYLEAFGYPRDIIGVLWALGVFVEILVFVLMHRWLLRYGAGKLLVFALAATVLRWVMVGVGVRYIVVLVLAQTLHAASFGLVHACAIHMVHRIFPGRLQGRGQALYSSLSFGLGGALGSLASGYIWTELGPRWIYYAAAFIALLGLVAAWWAVRLRRWDGTAPDEGETWWGCPETDRKHTRGRAARL